LRCPIWTGDLTPPVDLAATDDMGECRLSVPPTELYQAFCHDGENDGGADFCFYEQPPQDHF
jgi:hypothetical protein